MLIKTLAGVCLFALAGAGIGYSKILCAGGECAITGTPYGGAFFGGMLGLVVMSGLTPNAGAMPTQDPSDDEPDAEDKPQ